VQFQTDPGELTTAPLVILPTLPLLEDGKAAQMLNSQSSLRTRAFSFKEKKMLLYVLIIPLLFLAKTQAWNGQYLAQNLLNQKLVSIHLKTYTNVYAKEKKKGT